MPSRKQTKRASYTPVLLAGFLGLLCIAALQNHEATLSAFSFFGLGEGDEMDHVASPVSEQACGNGVMEDGEECDDGDGDNEDDCLTLCKHNICGDGYPNFSGFGLGEQWIQECDDANKVDGDGCSADCKVEDGCGNGRIDDGEECDDGNDEYEDGCSGMCLIESCPNGVVDGAYIPTEDTGGDTGGGIWVGEECDDGNTNEIDRCLPDCTFAKCGDGIINESAGGFGFGDGPAMEECDDGNGESGDGCNDQCLLEFCGNGRIDQYSVGDLFTHTEECDDANDDDSDSCKSDCTRAYCGDGILNLDDYGSLEECERHIPIDEEVHGPGYICNINCRVVQCELQEDDGYASSSSSRANPDGGIGGALGGSW